MTTKRAGDNFTLRLRQIVEITVDHLGTQELVSLMEEPNLDLNGERPWDYLMTTDERGFELFLNLVRRYIAAKNTVEQMESQGESLPNLHPKEGR